MDINRTQTNHTDEQNEHERKVRAMSVCHFCPSTNQLYSAFLKLAWHSFTTPCVVRPLTHFSCMSLKVCSRKTCLFLFLFFLPWAVCSFWSTRPFKQNNPKVLWVQGDGFGQFLFRQFSVLEGILGLVWQYTVVGWSIARHFSVLVPKRYLSSFSFSPHFVLAAFF